MIGFLGGDTIETELTKQLKLGIWNYTNKQGVFGCFEVTIGWFGKERVDYMTYDTNGIWRCYEIKITKSDFHSKNHNTFVGDYNYYIMTDELYEQVKNEIAEGIGVYIPKDSKFLGYPELQSKIRAKKQELKIDEQILKNSMIRSLCREVNKQMQEGNKFRLQDYKRDNKKMENTIHNLKIELRDVKNELYFMKYPKQKNEFDDFK